jgi:hypothetical protein
LGSQIAEFAPALVVLAAFVFLPLVDLAIVPIRWMMAQEIVNAYSRKLALCECFSQSLQVMQADPSLSTRLIQIGGVTLSSVGASLRIARIFNRPHAEESIVVAMPGEIPAEWLPNGAKAPCTYALDVQAQAMMSPAILLSSSVKVPGLTAPIPINITASHTWANLGRNPFTRKYFVNE